MVDEIVPQVIFVDVVDGTGWAPPVGSKVEVTLSPDQVVLRNSQSEEFRCALGDITDVHINGNTRTSGPRIFGGGFGVKGAIEGIAAATLVNRLTSKSHKWVTVTIAGRTGRVVLVAADMAELQMRAFFRPVQDRLIKLKSGSGAVQNEDLVTTLERLVSLHESGVLDDSDFELLKERALGQLRPHGTDT